MECRFWGHVVYDTSSSLDLEHGPPHQVPIKVTTDEVVDSEGLGEVAFRPVVDGIKAPSPLFTRVLYVPALSNNLFATCPLARKLGVKIIYDENRVDLIQEGETILQAKYRGDAAYLEGVTVESHIEEKAYTASSYPKPSKHLWHQRLGHMGRDQLDEPIKKDLAIDVVIKDQAPLPPICEACIAGKQHCDPFPSSEPVPTHPLEIVVSDLKGPLPTTDDSERYWITFTDILTRYTVTYILTQKSEAFDCFVEYKALAENQTGQKIRTFRNDKGGGYIGKKWGDYFTEHGIYHDRTTTDTPQSNGIAERKNRTLEESITSMLATAKLPAACWVCALALAARIMNATPISSVKDTVQGLPWEETRPQHASHLWMQSLRPCPEAC